MAVEVSATQRNPHQGTIRRPRLSFEDGYVMIPNVWARDMRIKPSSKGLLIWLMSHREGFETGVSHIAKVHGVGRDAARSMVTDLEEHGYLDRELIRGASGLFEGTDWQLCDPFEEARNQLDGIALTDPMFPDEEENPRSEPVTGNPTTDEPTTENPAPVNPTTKEDHLEETLKPKISETNGSNHARETPGQAVARAVRAAVEAEGKHQPVKRPDYSKGSGSRFTAPPAPHVPRYDPRTAPAEPKPRTVEDDAAVARLEAIPCPSNKPAHLIPATSTLCLWCGIDANTLEHNA